MARVPGPPPVAPGSDAGLQAPAPWAVYREAMLGGWGPTVRLCLILAVRWGIPVAGLVRLTGLVLAHAR
jgi:hypothetical protein